MEPGFLEKMRRKDPAQVDYWELMEEQGSIVIASHDTFLFRTGMQMAIQPDYACFFWDRSGMGGNRLIHRFAGVIDEDYRGEWFVRLYNFNEESQRIDVGDRIVQGVFHERIIADFPVTTDALPASVRGTAGFGSTGD